MFSPIFDGQPPLKFWPIIVLLPGFLGMSSDSPRTPYLPPYRLKRGYVATSIGKIRGFPDWFDCPDYIEAPSLVPGQRISSFLSCPEASLGNVSVLWTANFKASLKSLPWLCHFNAYFLPEVYDWIFQNNVRPSSFHCLPTAQVVQESWLLLFLLLTEVEISVLKPEQGDTWGFLEGLNSHPEGPEGHMVWLEEVRVIVWHHLLDYLYM